MAALALNMANYGQRVIPKRHYFLPWKYREFLELIAL